VNEASVVVGVDGCDSCQAALRYAIEETGRRGCRLTIVVAYRRPGVSVIESAGPADEDLAAQAQATAQRCLDLAEKTIVPDDLDCRVLTEEMPPVDALAAGAQNAIVIVVGRHHGEAARRDAPGSTTARLLDHSPLPVISVPPGYGC
jgi:nucleotide-binding universal stress UspA family protein